jgi:hypothetical protein
MKSKYDDEGSASDSEPLPAASLPEDTTHVSDLPEEPKLAGSEYA